MPFFFSSPLFLHSGTFCILGLSTLVLFLGFFLLLRIKHPNADEMGSFFSRTVKDDEEDSLEPYMEVVDEHSTSSNNAAMDLVIDKLFSQEGLGLRILTQMKDRGGSSSVLSRKVMDARIVTFQSMPLRWYSSLWVKKVPLLYKQLHVEAKQCDPRSSTLDFGVKLTQGKVFGFQNETEMYRMMEEKLEDDLEKLFRPLRIEEDDKISHALYGGNSHEILITHEPSNIEISREVLRCLIPGAWLNDEVINLYLELLKERERSEPNKFLKCHFFNTFFYKKMTSGKTGYNYSAVRRWTTKKKLGYTLIQCDKIFVPIHKDEHWCLAVMNIKDKSLQYLDSLGVTDNHALNTVAIYLIDETRDKGDKEIDLTSWKKESVNDLPLQENGSDCGMFMIKYIDFYTRGLKPFFKQKHMAYFRKKTALEILKLRAE